MRIFLTGGTGIIGEAVVKELIGAGHDVLALARSEQAAGFLGSWGAAAHRGDLTDFESLAEGARQCDGVIHLAFDHSDLHGWAEMDRQVIEAFADALEGSGKALVTTSVIAIVKSGNVATEQDLPSSDAIGGFRRGSEEATREAAARGVRSAIVRLPPTVHGPGDRSFLPTLIAIARRAGFSAYVGEGNNRWPAVHRLDAARLFRLAVESAAPGECLHAAAEDGVAMKAIAGTIADRLGVPARSQSPDEAARHFGWFTRFVAMDCHASSEITRARMGWAPREPGLLADIREGGYFDENAAAMFKV